MPEVTEKKIVIDGVEFIAPNRYAEGHVLTAIEARTLNQTRAENLRNNFAKTVKAAKDPAAAGKEGVPTFDQLPSLFAAYESAYTFAMPGAAGPALDPIEREAMRVAKEMVKKSLADEGRKITDVPSGMTKEQWEEKLEAAYQQVADSEGVRAHAKKVVAAKSKSKDLSLASLGISLTGGSAPDEAGTLA